MSTIILHLRFDEERSESEILQIHRIYNSPSINHNETNNKESLSKVKATMSMHGESIAVGDFNLHHSSWADLFYFKQHLLANDLLNIMQNVKISLTLLKDIITRDYQEAQIIMNLSFVTDDIANKLIYCEINEKVENAFDHLSIRTILDLRTQEEPHVILDATERKWMWKNSTMY